MSAECGRCGDCCDVILIRCTKRELREIDGEDARFILRHWRRINKAEAEQRNPGVTQSGNTKFYECLRFDKETRLCTAHDERPPVCRGFPWYSGNPNVGNVAPFKRCTYWFDVPKNEWTQGVTPCSTNPVGASKNA